MTWDLRRFWWRRAWVLARRPIWRLRILWMMWREPSVKSVIMVMGPEPIKRSIEFGVSVSSSFADALLTAWQHLSLVTQTKILSMKMELANEQNRALRIENEIKGHQLEELLEHLHLDGKVH